METDPRPGWSRFTLYSYAVLAYTMMVVLWGAFVRATGSGAGCGSHWPLCNGEVIPRAPRAATLIEFTHRITSGLSLLAVVVLVLWGFHLFGQGSRVRRFAVLSAVFLAVEAFLGAGLVLLEYVAHNASWGRAIYLSAHLLNTQILLAMLLLTAFFSHAPSPLRRQRSGWVAASIPVALLLSVTGALAALGDTLLLGPSVSPAELTDKAQDLVRLRLIHPFFALAAGGFLMYAALGGALRERDRLAVRARVAAAALILIQWIAGAVNIVLKAPVWMQLLHLLLANLLWLALVILFVQTDTVDSR